MWEKRASCKSVMKLLPTDGTNCSRGRILADGVDITDYTRAEICHEAAGKSILHGVSGSDDIPQSDDDHR